MQQGRRGEAVAELELALSEDAGNPELHLERARALAALGLASALDAYQLAALNAEVLGRRPPDEREAFGRLSPRVRTVVSAATGLEGPGAGRYRHAFAQYLTERKLWAQALRQWQMVLVEEPKNATAHFGHGVALDALGARDQAVEAYREAVALDAGSVAMRLRLAQGLWQTDQYYQAMNEWRTVLGQAPGNVEARLALARAHVRTGNPAEASHEYQRLRQIAPNRSEVQEELARLGRAAR